MGGCATGALTQVAGVGPQNVHLTCDPQMTFWKGGYQRYTQFAFCISPQEACSSVKLGGKVTFKYERSGDGVYRAYFRPRFIAASDTSGTPNEPGNQNSYTNAVAYAMIKELCLNIGGTTFTEQTREFMYLWDKLSSSNEKRLREMIGFSETAQGLIDFGRTERTYYAPLTVWHTRAPSQMLPLIALQYHSVSVEVVTETQANLVCITGDKVGTSNLETDDALVSFDMLLEYVYFDTMERRMLAQQASEYIFTEEQFTGAKSHAAGQTSQSIRHTFNHVAREILQICRRDAVVNPSAQAIANGTCPNQWFNFSGVPDSYDGGVTFNVPTDPMATIEHQINGHNISEKFEAPFYRLVQPYQFHTNVPDAFIYVLSFSLY